MDKILFVTASLSRSGTQRVVSLLANACAECGAEVHIATLLPTAAGYPLDASVYLHDLSGGGSYLRRIPRWIWKIRRLLADLRPGKAVSFSGRVNLLTILAGVGMGVPIWISERNDPAHDRKSALERQLCRWIYPKANCVVFQTQYQQRWYGKRCAHNSRVIGNPIAAQAYHGAHPDGDILAVGKLMSQKNHAMLIRAFSQIANKYPEKRVHIFGEGTLRQPLQALIDSLGLHGRVILEGNSPNIFAKMRQYRYFVMSSDYEGLSNALLEAMMSGMTCISTAWNGIEAVGQGGRDLYLVKVGDVQALADALDALLSGRLSDCGPSACLSAMRYQQDRILAQWLDALGLRKCADPEEASL